MIKSSDTQFVRFVPSIFSGYAAKFTQFGREFVLNEQNLQIRIKNLKKSNIDTSVESAVLAEMTRKNKEKENNDKE